MSGTDLISVTRRVSIRCQVPGPTSPWLGYVALSSTVLCSTWVTVRDKLSSSLLMPWFGKMNVKLTKELIAIHRMEAFYRLLISTLAVPWRSYIMATDSQLFSFLLSTEQECFSANIFYSFLSVANIIYHTGGSLLRYWYVKSSLRPEVAQGFMSRKTYYICLGVPQILLFLHFLDALYVYNTKEDFPLLLYQACTKPYSDYSMPFHKLMPFQVFMMYGYVALMIYSNIYLYMFLR